MATIEASGPVNGNYTHQAYDANYTPSQQPTSQPAQQAPASEIPKDEVGWYFVEQYYTNLSKSPDRLYLFYNKRSQYVSGIEKDKVNVCSGQKAINERIRELDFKDTKVRVTNVDSQGSDANIVIQVIGEISNQGEPHKRFVQTFVLAEQTNGYFVLNDIFRYLAEESDEDEEAQQEPSAPANGIHESEALEKAESLGQNAEGTIVEEDLSKVNHKLEEVAKEEPAVHETVSIASTENHPEEPENPRTEETPATAIDETLSKDAEIAMAREAVEPEKPKGPAPSPAPTAAKAVPIAAPASPPKPAAPRTWASLAASAHKVATPAVAAPVAQQTPASQPKQTAPTQPAAAAVVAPLTSAPPRDQSPVTSQTEATGWQSVAGHKKELSRAVNQVPTIESEQKRAYIKNVYSQVEDSTLRSTLAKFGDIEYLDISRPKNCAFVDFKTTAGFNAAVNANPHSVNGIELKVEERRQRPDQYRGGFSRGGAARGRGGIGGQTSRGGFQPRGRGGPVRGGRGVSQET